MRKHKPVIGITLGDPAGVGPEIALKTIKSLDQTSTPFIPVLIGSADVLKQYHSLYEKNNTVTIPATLDERIQDSNGPFICDIPLSADVPVPGKGNIDTGRDSLRYVNIALDLWISGVIDCMVTGPVNKSLIEKSGVVFTGHTEYIADYIGEKNPCMLMYSEKYRVILVTTHIPLSHVSGEVTAERIRQVALTANDAISKIEGRPVKIAVCGLDPHCGDEGAIGTFDMEVTRPVIEELKGHGIKISGPFAADTVFMPEKWETYDCVVALYHDQGLIPFKVLAFDRGVNVTLGLSIIRTSVDHGTAFDIAGKNIAGHSSMVEACNLAYSLLTGKNG